MANTILKMVNDIVGFDPKLEQNIKSQRNQEVVNYLKTITNLQNARDYRGASLLHVTAEHGNENITKYLLTMGFDVNLQDHHGRTALMAAVNRGHFSIAKILLESNADFRICNKYEVSALEIAITTDTLVLSENARINSSLNPQGINKYWQIIEIMLNRLDEWYEFDSEKIANELLRINCQLYHVVFMNNSQVMKIMIKKGSLIDAIDFFEGQTALHFAVRLWKLEKVKILLDNGASVEIFNCYRKTPIMCIYDLTNSRRTMPYCEVQLVKLFLEHKPIFSITNKDGLGVIDQMYRIFSNGSKEAIHLAIMANHENLFLLKNERQETLLHALAVNSNPGIEEILKGRKIDVNAKDAHGNTALHLALTFAIFHHFEYSIIEYLLSQGACPNITNNYGKSPIFEPFIKYMPEKSPVIEQRLNYIRLMIEYGADLESTMDDVTILGKISENENFFALAKPVLAQFAIKDALGVPISIIIQDQIQSKVQFKTHFDACVKQLKDAKTSMIIKSVSVFNLLTASDKNISLYGRKKYLVTVLSKFIDQLKLDPDYMYIIRKRSSKILRIGEAREKAEEIICHTIGILYGHNSIITSLIVEFLDDEEVQELSLKKLST